MNSGIRVEEFGATIYDKHEYFTHRQWEETERVIKVSKDDAKLLAKRSSMPVKQAVCILGRVEELYSVASSMNTRIKMNGQRKRALIGSLSEILLSENAQEFYKKLLELKHQDIDEICDAADPLAVYQRF